MDYKNLFEKFNEGGKLLLPDATVTFDAIPWSKHPAFEGVELKHIITSERTDGQFSYHLVRIAPNKKIGSHIHEKQLETHEVISGTGVCVNDGVELPYEAGVISIFPIGVPHEVIAGDDGLCLFAKFYARPLLIGLSGYISFVSLNGTSAPEGIGVFWGIIPEEYL